MTKIRGPQPIGSYKPEDVIFLLKDISGAQLERPTEDREEAIQSGVHYSEMLPVEYRPTERYLSLFHETLSEASYRIAEAAGTVAELILHRKGPDVVLASLARAGTPVGVLIKRYLKQIHNLDVPHYSLSIIRGKGMDENAVLYIAQQHPHRRIQFVDGWTGKGAIRRVLTESCRKLREKYGLEVEDDLAVLADPGRCAETFGTREDYLIPSACLNSTVSGLVSRTVLRDDLIGPGEFHGAKYYREWMEEDLTNYFADMISGQFAAVFRKAQLAAEQLLEQQDDSRVTWQGMKDVRRIQQVFGIPDSNLIKPGVGETTRVLLRRIPWKILVNRLDNPDLKHIRMLAAERNVPVEEFPGLSYSCCGIIKPLKEGTV
ncbi:cysteine protease StiP family protein [Paenibacillus tarimensis]|uniref:cysteine protease StiP family protein n=1 Tax=Paenibacillus tarimensis TaxID=416012 RepID=UPI001F3B1DEF|nr:cysteine protease StiP family protein [Paenibacillus tarimensis]MCF2944595.1 cysteine protease StiP family protein [Paenibacillus tarimensis]